MPGEVARPYTDEQIEGEEVTKKHIIAFLQESASNTFLQENKLRGGVKNVAKTKTKDQLIADYKALFETKSFKEEGDEEGATSAEAVSELTDKTAKLEVKEDERPRFKKNSTKKGDKINYPRKGDTVSIYYTGKLEDGTVFDTNVVTGRKAKSSQPLRFKCGSGNVIRGMDEALMTMSSGEKATVTIEPEWAYGYRGLEGKVPRNATLIFEIELTRVD